MTRDKPMKLRRRGFTIGVSAIVLAALWALSRWPWFVEEVYARHIAFQIGRALSLLSGRAAVSVAELALGGIVLYVVVSFAIVATRVVRRQRSFGNALGVGALRLVNATAAILAAFYLFWGLNYARAPLAVRLGWTPIDRPTTDDEMAVQTDEIATLTRQLLVATNEAYREVTGTDDFGSPTQQTDTATGLDATLEAAYGRVQTELGLEPAVASARGRAKPLIASVLLNHLRLGGFYFPWTGEANYNGLMPGSDLPHAVAHEKAHQRGIALEDEANFVGYIACISSADPYIRYSGYLFGHGQLLNELARRDRARAREIWNLRLPGVQRDVDFTIAFWRQYEGRAARMSEAFNNTYLRSQGERRGTAAYAASRNLIVVFARHNGGRATIR